MEEKLMMLGLRPERALPAWVTRRGRGKWGAEVDWNGVQAMSEDEAMAAVQALAVGEEHAAKVRAVLEALAEIASAGPSAPVEEVTMRYLVKVMQRPGVTRVTTVLWHWRVLSTFWPTLRRSSRIMAFVTGLMILSPVAPERAGRTVERSCDLARVMRACDVLLRVPARINLLVVQAAVNLLAGGRLRETIRAMTRGGNAWSVKRMGDGSVCVWISQAEPKDDLKGLQPHLRPKAVVIPEGWLMAAPERIRMEKGEEDVVARVTGQLVRQEGQVSGVTAMRRMVAARTKHVAEDMGANEEEAIGIVRDVLGHAPGSASTMRYVAERLGRSKEKMLEAIAAKRGRVGLRTDTGRL